MFGAVRGSPRLHWGLDGAKLEAQGWAEEMGTGPIAWAFCGSVTFAVKPLGNADDQGKHRRHTFLLYGEALLHRTEPDLHRSKAAFHRRKAVLQIAYLSGQGQNARAEKLKTYFFVTHGDFFGSVFLLLTTKPPTN